MAATTRSARHAARRILAFIALAAAMAALAGFEGDAGGHPGVLDLGGGIAIGADGSVVGATPPFAESSLDAIDFLFATESQWRSLALEMQIGPTDVARAQAR